MSAKTRRERRRAEAQIPVDTDWLWSCPVGMPLRDIAHKLNFTGEPQTELSARAWADELQFRDEIYRALKVGPCPCAAAAYVVWGGLDDHLCDACENGRLIVIRDLAHDLPSVVQIMIAIIGSRHQNRGFQFFHGLEGARFALVLEGWNSSTITVRSRHKTTYSVAHIANTGGAL